MRFQTAFDNRYYWLKDLSKDERLLVVNGIQSVGWNRACTELFANRVGRKSVHVHFDVRTDFLIGQKLTRNYLHHRQRRLDNTCAPDVCMSLCESNFLKYRPLINVT